MNNVKHNSLSKRVKQESTNLTREETRILILEIHQLLYEITILCTLLNSYVFEFFSTAFVLAECMTVHL